MSEKHDMCVRLTLSALKKLFYMPEYLIILLGIIALSFSLQKKFQIKLFENKKQMFFFWSVIYIFGTIWDNFAIWRQHWIYPGPGVLKINIGLVPLEDYIIAFALPYFLLVLYKIVSKKL